MNKQDIIDGVKRKLGFGRVFNKAAKKAEQEEIDEKTKEFLKKNKIKKLKSVGDDK